ncbi:cytochrome b [Aeromonas sp. MR16]|uniref:cytochrome b n=1 Tax=Aeromonas sp. MR16 TaxID=2923420 RepID=UPI001F4ADCAD|nr:cytochrome b [Aeromonas sp. MR16]MCH7373600.1 cytochrome b [Aeromonas sp. MR16]
MLQHTKQRYCNLSIALHWLTLLLIMTVYCLMEFRDIFPRGSAGRELMKEGHFMTGLLILAIVVIRLLVRFGNPTPRIVPESSALMNKLARLAHLTLYCFLILTPLLGWLTLSASGKSVPLFGFEFPTLMAQNDGLKGTIKEFHETLANIGYALIFLHVSAALYHHHVLRDNTLTNMLPKRHRL